MKNISFILLPLYQYTLVLGEEFQSFKTEIYSCTYIGWANQAPLWLLKDSNISHYLNLPINSPKIIIPLYIIHSQHDCSAQMNSNLMISVTKLTRYRLFAVADHQIFIRLWGTIMQGPYNFAICTSCQWIICFIRYFIKVSYA